MQTITLTGYPSGATDVYAYYIGRTLASYVADKVLFVEGTGPDTGMYTATVDESKGTSIVAFVGAAQPASWAEALVGVGWDLSNDAAEILTAFKADPQLGTADGGLVAEVNKIQRSATAVQAGEVWAESNAAIAAGVYESLAGIQPTVSLTFDPRTMLIRLVDGDDWLEDIRTIDIPITLPSTITDLGKCTATFGAVKSSVRIDRVAEVLEIEGKPHIRLTFIRADTLNKPAGRFNWDARVQYTDASVTSTITVYNGVLELIRGIAKLPGEIS